MIRCFVRRLAVALCVGVGVGSAVAAPSLVEHAPSSQVFGEPSGTTQRNPATPREDEAVTLFFRVSFQFTYDHVAVYYTTDGTDPSGSFGTPTGTTQLLTNTAGSVTFVRNENSGGTRDWWRATLPSGRGYGQTVKYRLSAWRPFDGSEVFAGGGQVFAYTNKLAWPGQGSNFIPQNGIGYPPVSFYKEEAVVGNNWINQMIDRNGTVFDVYYPGAGCVQGVGTKNEGYVDGLDTFPGGLPLSNRGQMHLNQMQPGIRINGITYWLSNQNGSDYTDVAQHYTAGSNSVATSQRLVAAGNNILVQQYDFSPKGVAYPTASGGGPLRGMTMKRMVLTNNGAAPVSMNVYFYGDWAINGGDDYDAAFTDPARGVMYARDNTYRVVNNTGSIGPGQEYNPTTFGGYEKNVSVYLGVAMKTAPAVGAAGGTPAADFWRDSSADDGMGWVGQKLTLASGESKEVSFCIIGGFDNFAGATGTYGAQMAPVADWFLSQSVAGLMTQTDTYWNNWLASGVRISTPDARLNELFDRGLLATMLHFDEAHGGLIAGFRNGAYPFVWPRDMAWAAVTLARTGHTDTVRQMTRFLRDITYRDFETWNAGNTPGQNAAGGVPYYGTRKGFWKQKYSTNGYVVWGAPQVDETAVLPWMVYYNYLVEGDPAYLTEAEAGNPANSNYAVVKDAAIAMSQTSVVDGSRLNLRPSYSGSGTRMMYSNNIWEDQYDTLIFSNANIVRGLRDAANIATILGLPADAADFTIRANAVLAGLNDKLDWDGENTDISLLGITYPFEVTGASDPRAAKVVDRINGVRRRFNNSEGFSRPLMRFAGEYINDASGYVGMLDRYYGDGYWGNGALGPTPAGPWFLSTLWYGAYYAQRQDTTPGKGDIDNHLYRVNRCADHNGPVGLGAEQIAPSNALLYPGQTDFSLQAAWPNAWESMSFYVDALMLFMDYTPDAPGNTLRIEPKLPTGWPSMTYWNLRVGGKRLSVTVAEDARGTSHTFTNTTGGAVEFSTVLRIGANQTLCAATIDGVVVTPDSYDPATGRVVVSGSVSGTAGGSTVVRADVVCSCNIADIVAIGGLPPPDGLLTGDDFNAFIAAFAGGCP